MTYNPVCQNGSGVKITLNLASPKRLKKVGQKAQCILCDQVLTNLSLKPSKLKIYFTTHGGSAAYGIEALKTKRARYDQKGTLPQLHKTITTRQKPILMASYRAAYLIAKSKKAHNIGENLIKTCLVKMADILLGNEAARKLSKISMSDNSVKRRIEVTSSDILAQIVHGIKKNAFPIALQLDESTDVACMSQPFFFFFTINLKLIIVHVEIKIVNKEAATKRSTLLHAQHQ